MKGLIERDNKLYIRKIYRDSTGKKKQIWRKVETRSEGKSLLREIENDLANGTESFENRDSLDSYLDKWLSMTKGTISDRTHGDYVSLLRLYFRPKALLEVSRRRLWEGLTQRGRTRDKNRD